MWTTFYTPCAAHIQSRAVWRPSTTLHCAQSADARRLSSLICVAYQTSRPLPTSSPLRYSSGRFTTAQERKFFHTMTAQKSHCVSATAIFFYREPQQRFTKLQTGLYMIRAMHSIPIWMLILELLIWIHMRLFNRSYVIRPLSTYWPVLAFTRAPSRTRSQKAAQLQFFCRLYARQAWQARLHIRHVGYRFLRLKPWFHVKVKLL